VNILIGITGSIAAYKTLDLIRRRIRQGDSVRIMLTAAAGHFVTPLCCQTLSQNEVYQDQFVLTRGIKHLTLAEWADIFVVAPATANIIGKTASGIADDLMSTTLISFQKPILFVPAMDTGMWENPIVQRNVAWLRVAGYHVLEPVQGALASGKIGRGRFPDIEIISRAIDAAHKGCASLRGKNILISGGRTEEDIDPVRVITNRSSGAMARELLYAVVARGGNARCVMGRISVSVSEHADVMRVRTANEMLQALQHHVPWCDCLIMAAAVGDYRPSRKRAHKSHDRDLKLKLAKNPDILKALQSQKGDRYFIGFSLEDKDALQRGRTKLTQKGLDLIVLNTYATIGQEQIKARLLRAKGPARTLGPLTKRECAHRILDAYLKYGVSATERD
jgi:phosphopantothenoylcysteine decarboxylase/phosphopantothenate--cysteine ligase